MYAEAVMVMNFEPAQNPFEATNRELRSRGEAPLSEREYAFLCARWDKTQYQCKDADGLADLAQEHRENRREYAEYDLVRDAKSGRITAAEAPPWWRLYCHRVSEPYMSRRAEVQERLGLEEPLTVEYLGVYMRTAFAYSQIHARRIPNNMDEVLRFPLGSGQTGYLRIARLAVPEDDAVMLRAAEALNERRAQVGKKPVSLPSLGQPQISPYWWLWHHAATIAQETGAEDAAAVAFLVCNEPLVIPWLEVRTIERGQGVGFELSVGTPAVNADVVASAYAAAVAESGQQPPEGSAIEAPAVELVIAYEEALRRFPKGRGPSNKGVKERRVASLPEHVREHFGQDPDTVDKMYHRKAKMLPDDLKPRGGDTQ
jgi:hypothetical protein